MTEKIAKDFIGALNKLEANRDLKTICGLFSENCEIGNVVTEDKNIGAREFWTSYRGSFDKVKTSREIHGRADRQNFTSLVQSRRFLRA